jgi:hypothetical protein
MTTLADLEAQRAELVETRSTGVRSTSFGDDKAEYRSDREIAAAIAAIDREIAALQGRRVTTFLPHFSKGL